MTVEPAWAHGLFAPETDAGARQLAIEAASWPAIEAAQRRAFALLVLASLDAEAAGATRLGLDRVADRVARLAAVEADRAAAARLAGALARSGGRGDAPAGLEPFVGAPGDYRPFIVDAGHLYHERNLRLETRLAEALAARLAAPATGLSVAQRTHALAAATDPAGRRWTASQAAAVQAALERPVAAITGGPGTGKTALIGGIVRGWTALGISPDAIAIAAPTGKAANRIAELLPPGSPTPTTLHRLLGASTGGGLTRSSGFRHHENHRLPHAGVILDEASMVGLALMEQLVRALAPGARLVLIGDADQLPAVEVGNVLHDLRPIAVPLLESHRMDPSDPAGAAVFDAAQAIAAGDLGARGVPPLPRAADVPDAGFSCLEGGPRQLAAFLDRWYATFVAPVPAGVDPADAPAVTGALDRQRRARLLTVTRVGPTGASRINATLARRVAADAGVALAAGDLLPGMPVVMTRNDHDRGLYNGDQGLVLRGAGPEPTLVVSFPRAGVPVALPLSSVRGAVELAYATTIHRAQGSELDHAALLLPEQDLPLLTRELVYTAVTRVRRSIVVVGKRALLDAAVARPLERSSGLGERLAHAGAFSSPRR
jgi:exodeoxyribonuclease V alpha subunit